MSDSAGGPSTVGVTESVAWLERYSAVILPVLVVAEQIGVPLPAVPALLVVGALAAQETDIHSTRNDLSESIRTNAIELLDARLADAMDLQTQLKQAHWNVKDPTFTFAAHIERGDRAV